MPIQRITCIKKTCIKCSLVLQAHMQNTAYWIWKKSGIQQGVMFCYCRCSSSTKERVTRKLTCLGSASDMHNYLTDDGKNGTFQRRKGLCQKKKNIMYQENQQILKLYTPMRNTKRFIHTAHFFLQRATACIYGIIFSSYILRSIFGYK